jgi:hypothetical protein
MEEPSSLLRQVTKDVWPNPATLTTNETFTAAALSEYRANKTGTGTFNLLIIVNISTHIYRCSSSYLAFQFQNSRLVLLQILIYATREVDTEIKRNEFVIRLVIVVSKIEIQS